MVLGQTVTVVNKSGKVVSTGKHLVNVFKEAKSAYRERKAEITALRDAEESEKKALKAIKNLSIEDDKASRTSSRRSHRSSRDGKSRKPPMERGYSDSFYTNDHARPSRRNRESSLRYEYDSDNDQIQRNELVRRHTDAPRQLEERPKTSRSASLSDIDMDLAYGDLPPPLPLRQNDELELRTKMMKLQTLLDEANCMQHSVIAMIENLQKNPDALAAVALTLGEISTIASKMAPGMITALKGSFPMVIALLASPQFMIAAGVGVGVTVIMLGGYKIIKKVQQRKADKLIEEGEETRSESAVSEYDELREINNDLSRIEMWRRGIADAEAEPNTPGTSVDGEFVTPGANKYFIEEGVLRQDDLKSMRSGRSSKSKKSRSKESSSKEKEKEKSKKDRKKKEPSGLRMLFKSH